MRFILWTAGDVEPSVLASIRAGASSPVELVSGIEAAVAAAKDNGIGGIIGLSPVGSRAVQFLAACANAMPDVPRILMARADSLETVLSAINEAHVAQFVRLPCSAESVRLGIEKAQRLGS